MDEKRLKQAWHGMIFRCERKGGASARYYRDKGIRVCDEWRNSFDAFKDWALANGYDDTLSIDRIDSDGNYEPSNCQWIPFNENRLKAIKGRKVKSGWRKTERNTSEPTRRLRPPKPPKLPKPPKTPKPKGHYSVEMYSYDTMGNTRHFKTLATGLMYAEAKKFSSQCAAEDKHHSFGYVAKRHKKPQAMWKYNQNPPKDGARGLRKDG